MRSVALYALAALLATPAAADPLEALVVHEEPRALPGFAFQGPEGEARVADWAGEAVVLNFWATWCAPCLEEMPALDRLAGALEGEGVAVVAVSADRDPERAAAWLDENDIENLALHSDPGFSAPQALRIGALPTTLLIDAEGREVARYEGDAEWDAPAAVARVRALLAPPEG